MTIALGILASDGVLIATDREETSFNDTKYAQNKIRGAHHWTSDEQRNMLLAGAGDAHFIDAFAQSIEKDVLKDKRIKGRPRVVFDDALERFYKRKVIPCDPFHGGPDFQLVIAYQGDGRSHLFKSQYDAVLESDSFVVVGIGAMVAGPILSRLISHRKVSIKEAVMIASYAVLEAKEAVQGVGKDTDVLAMFNSGKLERTVPPDQDRLDAALSEYGSDLEPMVFRAIAGKVDPESVTSKIRAFQDTFADILGNSFTTPSPSDPSNPIRRPTPPSSRRGRKS